MQAPTDQKVGGSNPSERASTSPAHLGTSAPRRGLPPTDGPRHVHGRHVVPALVERRWPARSTLPVATVRWWCWRNRPAAAVVFARDVDNRTSADARVAEVAARLAEAKGASRAALANELTMVRTAVRAEKVSEVAAEFDRVDSIHRTVTIGSVDAFILWWSFARRSSPPWKPAFPRRSARLLRSAGLRRPLRRRCGYWPLRPLLGLGSRLSGPF
ncbi:MAG: hypothetical protein QOF15_1114 [Mycobacterium sp.]|nr:hypothetical protein [Mycobacterium sp.]